MNDWAILIVAALLHIRKVLLASSSRDGCHKRFMGFVRSPTELAHLLSCSLYEVRRRSGLYV